jgi:hypothetical protein
MDTHHLDYVEKQDIGSKKNQHGDKHVIELLLSQATNCNRENGCTDFEKPTNGV